MSAPEMTIPKDAVLNEMWSTVTTLTDEAIARALEKCKDAGFDPERGIISLQESFINLSAARCLLEDAINKRKLIQLPITVQREILSNLQAVSKALVGLTSGADEVVNLVTAIEALNTSIWKYGFHNLSDEVLGYQKKLNQLKAQEVQLAKIADELDDARKVGADVVQLSTELKERRNEVGALLEQIRQTTTSSTGLLDQIRDSESKTNALFATIAQHEKQGGELTSNIKTAYNELQALDTSIKKFYGDVDDYRRKINEGTEKAAALLSTYEASFKALTDETGSKVEAEIQSLRSSANVLKEELGGKIESKASETTQLLYKLTEETKEQLKSLQTDATAKVESALKDVQASSSGLITKSEEKLSSLEKAFEKRSEETVEANHQKTGLLIDELAKLKDQIREQLEQATGFTLFGAFQARQNEILKAKKFWEKMIALLVCISAAVTIWIAHEAQFYSAHSFAFWVKLSLTIPLGFAITFCTVQYSRERRLEEEYAFKSSISVSLNPYRDLIHSILEKDGNVDQNKYTDFVIDSVRNVFTPPTDKVFDTEKRPSGLTKKALKETAELVGTVMKAAK